MGTRLVKLLAPKNERIFGAHLGIIMKPLTPDETQQWLDTLDDQPMGASIIYHIGNLASARFGGVGYWKRPKEETTLHKVASIIYDLAWQGKLRIYHKRSKTRARICLTVGHSYVSDWVSDFEYWAVKI